MEQTIFKKPKTAVLSKYGYSCVDMHFHTKYSDGLNKIKTVLKKARKKCVGIAITDHNAISGAIEAHANAKGIMVIPAIEVSTLDGPHAIFYFYSISELTEFYNKHVKDFKRADPFSSINKTLNEIVEDSMKFNCLRCLAHPSGYFRRDVRKFLEKDARNLKIMNNIDAVEVINGEHLRRDNLDAIELRKEFNKGFTGGSDGHSSGELGRVVTCSEGQNAEDFLNSIVKRKNFVIGKEIKFRRIPSHSIAIRRHLRFVRKRLIQRWSSRYDGIRLKIKRNGEIKIKKAKIIKM